MNRGLRSGLLLASIVAALGAGAFGLSRIAIGSSSNEAAPTGSCTAAAREEIGASKAPDADQLARRWYRRHWRWRYI